MMFRGKKDRKRASEERERELSSKPLERFRTSKCRRELVGGLYIVGSAFNFD